MRFNGVSLCSVHEGLSIEKEVPPGTASHALETMQGNGGDIIADDRLEAGEYIARVNIAGCSENEGLHIRGLLAAWAFVKGKQTGELVPTHEPDKCYDAKLKGISNVEFIGQGFAVVEVRFLLPRPVMRSTNSDAAVGAGGVAARIGGTYECRPCLCQTLKTAQDGLVWVKDGKPILTIKGALKAGQVVKMDVKNESMTIDGEHAEARINMAGTRWQPGWWPGAHVITSTDDGKMEMRWHNEWL